MSVVSTSIKVTSLVLSTRSACASVLKETLALVAKSFTAVTVILSVLEKPVFVVYVISGTLPL